MDALTTEQNFEGTGLGDQIVFTTQLLKGDTEVGHQGGVCTVTSVQRGEAQCIATYAVRGGQITGQAPIRLGDPAPYAVAITGGSGNYRGVEGEIRVISATECNRGGPDLPPGGLFGPSDEGPGVSPAPSSFSAATFGSTSCGGRTAIDADELIWQGLMIAGRRP